MSANEWLGRVSHDLVKRLLWPARDRRDRGGPVVPGELAAALGSLVDEDGAPISAAALWGHLRAEAPTLPPAAGAALVAFAAALDQAVAAAAADDLDGVLALEQAYGQLARIVKQGGEPEGKR